MVKFMTGFGNLKEKRNDMDNMDDLKDPGIMSTKVPPLINLLRKLELKEAIKITSFNILHWLFRRKERLEK